MKFTKKTIYIGLFGLLYGIVAASSFWHAIAFFALANNSWMSGILAFAFEVGQAAVLFSLLTSKKDRSRVMPWVLMSMFTLVQVIGNVFSSYKYLINHSVANLRYFKEPIFIWMDLPDDQATVIITYIVGAILPITALLLTSMITNYLTDNEEEINNLTNSIINKENKENKENEKNKENEENTETINNVINNVDNVEEIKKDVNEVYNVEDTGSDGPDKVNIDNVEDTGSDGPDKVNIDNNEIEELKESYNKSEEKKKLEDEKIENKSNEISDKANIKESKFINL